MEEKAERHYDHRNGQAETLTPRSESHASFRTIRAEFIVFVTGYCKSAGDTYRARRTELVIADTGELGPLDVQVLQMNSWRCIRADRYVGAVHSQ